MFTFLGHAVDSRIGPCRVCCVELAFSVPLRVTSESPVGSCDSDEHLGASLHAVGYRMADASRRRQIEG